MGGIYLIGGKHMNKLCIFNKTKNCTSCGECDICDLNPSRKCNNCGKCLELEGYDIRAIKIDDIFENKGDLGDYQETERLHSDFNQAFVEEETWDYIDDIKDLKDLVEDEENLENYEEFPGLLSLVNKNDKKN